MMGCLQVLFHYPEMKFPQRLLTTATVVKEILKGKGKIEQSSFPSESVPQ